MHYVRSAGIYFVQTTIFFLNWRRENFERAAAKILTPYGKTIFEINYTLVLINGSEFSNSSFLA